MPMIGRLRKAALAADQWTLPFERPVDYRPLREEPHRRSVPSWVRWHDDWSSESRKA